MPKKNVVPQVDLEAHKFYKLMFLNPNDGAAYILEATPALMRRTIAYELKGRFTPGELQLMLEVMNGTILTPELAGQQISKGRADGMELEGLDEKYQVDKETMLEKLRELTAFQLAALEIWARGYWESKEYEKDGDGMARWVKMLT